MSSRDVRNFFDALRADRGLPARVMPSAFVAAMPDLDPLPEPEGPPGPDPGPAAPITLPPMPKSGPIGPGTS